MSVLSTFLHGQMVAFISFCAYCLIFEGLYCYALGRDVSFTDQPLIESALDELEAEQYPIRSMIHRIVTSKPFLEY